MTEQERKQRRTERKQRNQQRKQRLYIKQATKFQNAPASNRGKVTYKRRSIHVRTKLYLIRS